MGQCSQLISKEPLTWWFKAHFSILLMYLSCLRSGALCIHGEVQLFLLLLEVMMEPRSWPPQRFNKNSFVFTIWTKSVWMTQVLNINDGTWKCGGDMNIRRQGVRGLIFEKKKNSRRIVKEAWRWHLFGQLTWQGRAQYCLGGKPNQRLINA